MRQNRYKSAGAYSPLIILTFIADNFMRNHVRTLRRMWIKSKRLKNRPVIFTVNNVLEPIGSVQSVYATFSNAVVSLATRYF